MCAQVVYMHMRVAGGVVGGQQCISGTFLCALLLVSLGHGLKKAWSGAASQPASVVLPLLLTVQGLQEHRPPPATGARDLNSVPRLAQQTLLLPKHSSSPRTQKFLSKSWRLLLLFLMS